MQDNLLFVVSPPRAGSTLLQRMLGSHSQVLTHPEPHLITPLAHLGYHDLVDAAPYDHINAAEAVRTFVQHLPQGEQDYLDALRAYADTMYGRMLAPSGRRYFLDKTPAYALVLPFLRKLYPSARYVVLTRHPLSVMSSFANSFFNGDWQSANDFNPIVNRYVPAIATFLRDPPQHLLHVRYEELVARPKDELAKVFTFLGLENEPEAVNYGERFEAGQSATQGMGDPIAVHAHSRPVASSLDKWVDELAGDDDKLRLAERIVAELTPEDLERWGFDKASMFAPLTEAIRSGAVKAHRKPKTNNYILQRRIMLALKKDIDKRPHGKLIRRVRYYCNVLLRE
ncbi:MAG: sulfotransferase [Myxococcales bacterium]|nr:sulfotransferase [Myxococcales bacterium]MDD9968945.1 sulfotransferase [Myxococcales bacterium]